MQSDTGAALAVYHRPAEGRARATVCVLHGLAEHAARYARFAVALSEAGFHVYAHDHRGHGATRAPDAPIGVLARRNGLDRVIEDAVFVNERARAAHPDVPVLVFGHSMGGIIALNQAVSRPDTTDGVVIWNSSFDARRLSEARLGLALEGLLGARRPSGLMKERVFDAFNKDFAPNRTEFDWLSRDEAEVDKYVADPLCGFPASVSLWRDLLGGIERVQDEAAFGALPRATPFHLLAGAADPVTNNGAAIIALDERLRDMGFTDVSRVVLEKTRHETLNELNREEATRMLIRWIDRVVAS
jgi:alpha-beta hydrolase superfamily lysophospholipase